MILRWPVTFIEAKPMCGKRAKKLRKLALGLCPQGSQIGYYPDGSYRYTGMRRMYRDLKKAWNKGGDGSAKG